MSKNEPCVLIKKVQLAAIKLVGQYAERSKFLFKIN